MKRFKPSIGGMCVSLFVLVTLYSIVIPQSGQTQLNTIRGIPWMNTTREVTSGRVFWVSSTSGNAADDPAHGIDPLTPFATIAYARSQATPANGDTIYAMPAHTETIIAAGGITLTSTSPTSAVNLRIVGLGDGNARPIIRYSTATTASLLVTGANVTIENMIFDMTGIDALANPINVQAAGFTMRRCTFIVATSAGQATRAILTNASATSMLLEDNLFYGTLDAGTAEAVGLVGGYNAVIRNNVFSGAYTTDHGAIYAGTTTVQNITIQGNLIFNRTASSTIGVSLATGSTGFVVNNRFQVLASNAPIVCSGCAWLGNYYAATIATSGTLL